MEATETNRSDISAMRRYQPQLVAGALLALSTMSCTPASLHSKEPGIGSRFASLFHSSDLEVPENAELTSSYELLRRDQLPGVKVPEAAAINRYLSEFQRSNGAVLSNALQLNEGHSSVVAEIFDREGLPQELIALAILESGMRPNAKSSLGAVGIWQFLPCTARKYGLVVKGKVDERTDVRKSTEAVARYLKDLYKEFGDWALVVAAFNSGSSTVKRAIAKGKSTDFFVLAEGGYFLKETRDIVPKVLALSILCREIRPYHRTELSQENRLALLLH